jgi:Zn finger protein HypA/HybF involved in hydrogenase expression
MGEGFKASCGCGYESDYIYCGGGMMNFETHCGVPAKCDRCEAIVGVNYLAARKRCPRCRGTVTLYVTARPTTGSAADTDWTVGDEDLIFEESGNQCPKCGANTLTFVGGLMWD